MAVFVTFPSDQEKERAMNLILDRYFSVRAGFVISDLDAEILKQADVNFEVEKATLELLCK